MVATNEAFYGLEHTKTVRSIKNHVRDIPSNTGGTMYVHLVVFMDDYKGEFFQKKEIFTHKNGEYVKTGDNVCFTAKQKKDADEPDTLKLCDQNREDTNENEKIENEIKQSPRPISVSGTAIAFSVAYAKDITIEWYKNHPESTPEEILEFAAKISKGLKKVMIDNL